MWLVQLAVISSYLAMPNNPKSDGSVMTVWLQVRAMSQWRLLSVIPPCFLRTWSDAFAEQAVCCKDKRRDLCLCTAQPVTTCSGLWVLAQLPLELVFGPAGVCVE